MTNLVIVSVLTDTLNETSFTTHLPEEHIPDDSWPRLSQQLQGCLNILFLFLRVNYSQAIAVTVTAYQLEYLPVRVHEARI
jgi:hypothetical protein